jgi:hypothetical protein
MKLTEMYPTTLLKAQDVTDNGGEMVLTIKEVNMKEFSGDNGSKESKPINYFTNDKQMVCNKTNGNLIAGNLGQDTDMWIGKEITLIVQDVQFQDKMVPAIRVKNFNSHDAEIQAFWTKAHEMGFTQKDGLDHLKEYNGDFVKALAGLNAPF